MKTNCKKETQEGLLKKNEPNKFKNPISKYIADDNLGIEKNSLNYYLTEIDLVYISKIIYKWRLDTDEFRKLLYKPIISNTCYKIIRAINIPIAPTKYQFMSSGQVHHFSLIFRA